MISIYLLYPIKFNLMVKDGMHFPKIGNKAWMSTLTILIRYGARYSSQCNKAAKDIKSHRFKSNK